MGDKEASKGRLPSKFFKKKNSAMKEIQAWVNSNCEYAQIPEVTRNCGQLADNVTEERMLKAKLMELSKERYKFLVQKAYEKKLFSDRQMKKPELKHIILQAETVSRSRALTSIRSKSQYTMSTTKSSQLPRSYTSVSWYKVSENVEASTIDVAHSNTPMQNSDKKTTVNDTSNREKENSKLTSDRDSVWVTPMILQPVFATKKLIIGQSKKTVSTDQDASLQKRPDRATSGLTSSSIENAEWHKDLPMDNNFRRTTGHSTFINGQSAWNNNQSKWTNGQSSGISGNVKPSWYRQVQEKTKYGERISSVTCDPRYASLEQVLSPVVNKENLQLNDIVAQIESLHVRPKKKVSDSKKTKIEIKALEYMRSKGYVF
ncbi:hypothetical protein Bpfe_014621 [Biomphalaria pfeifferi]|uniref:Uncharacterized protein n=1 Tax=Biomphalaria pfeifferi TaxID=112525 RepID=A0AAD8F8U6_BIOPF|nr:hypothetical protein Bpfe_014621 [Biomphalaria pfeifferi]